MLRDAVPCLEIDARPELRRGFNMGGRAVVLGYYSSLARYHRGSGLMTGMTGEGPVFEALDYGAFESWNKPMPCVTFKNVHVISLEVRSAPPPSGAGAAAKAPGSTSDNRLVAYTIGYSNAFVGMVTSVDINKAATS